MNETTGGIDGTYLVTVYKGEILESDYASDKPGGVSYVARCSCGWSVVRQIESATRRQVVKHRAQVTA